MSNFLEEIENEFSRGRGRQSHLSSLDWHLAQKWEKRNIPLSLVLRAMSDVFKQNAAKHRSEPINSLRYFTPAVEKQFAEWQTNQVGKPIDESANWTETTPFVFGIDPAANQETEENYMQNQSSAASAAYADENTWILENILAELTPGAINELPEPLRSTVAITKGEILALLDDIAQKQLCSEKIEQRLTELRCELEIALIASVSDDEREKLILEVKTEYEKFLLMPTVEQKVLIRKLRTRFGLPELTLYAF